jgi:hypothetical protein
MSLYIFLGAPKKTIFYSKNYSDFIVKSYILVSKTISLAFQNWKIRIKQLHVSFQNTNCLHDNEFLFLVLVYIFLRHYYLPS